MPLDRGSGLYVNFTGGVFGTYVSQQIFIGNSSVLDQYGESNFVIYWDTGADVLSEAPEPSGLLLLGSGLIGILALHRRFAGRMKLVEID